MNNYLEVMRNLLENGKEIESRGGVKTRMLPQGCHLVFDMKDGFPLCTTKLVRIKSVWAELEWMLSGETSINRIMVEKYGVKFWRKWALDKKSGEMGPIYGAQWRDWGSVERKAQAEWNKLMEPIVPGSSQKVFETMLPINNVKILEDMSKQRDRIIDQVKKAQEFIDGNKFSRRIMVTAWNPSEIEQMALPPCHFSHQWIFDGERLNIHMSIRSWDMFIGAPFNIAFYALLLHIMAHRSGLEPGILVIHGSHVHLYDMHYEEAKIQTEREPLPLPQIKILCDKKDNVWDYEFDDIEISNYQHHPEIKAGVLV